MTSPAPAITACPELPSGALLVVVPGEPAPKRAHKVRLRGGEAHGYNDNHNRAHLAKVAWFARLAMGERDPFDGALVVEVTAYRAKGMPSSRIGQRRAEEGHVRPTTRPDADNIAKAVCDSLEKSGAVPETAWASETTRSSWKPQLLIQIRRVSGGDALTGVW